MRIIRVSHNANTVIRSFNNEALKFYTGVMSSKNLYNTRPSFEIDDNKNIHEKLDNIGNSLQITCNKRPYTLYYIMHDLHYEPTMTYISHWVDFRNNEVKGLCIVDNIKSGQENYCKKHRNKKMIIEELNFMFYLCEMEYTNKQLF
jgi:hypothetical protein